MENYNDFSTTFPSLMTAGQVVHMDDDGDMTIHISDMFKSCVDKARLRDLIAELNNEEDEYPLHCVIDKLKLLLGD